MKLKISQPLLLIAQNASEWFMITVFEVMFFYCRDFRPGARCEYTVQVQVRFCLVETTCEQADTFPSQIQVRVNNKPAALPVSTCRV